MLSCIGEPIGQDELLRRMDSGDVLLIDVRSEPEYRAGHLPERDFRTASPASPAASTVATRS